MADIKIIADKQEIVAIADAVRNKTGVTELMSISEIVDEINNISEQTVDLDEEIATQDDLISQIQIALDGKAYNKGIDTSDATATAEDIASGKTAYVDGSMITGTHECSSSGENEIVEQAQVTINTNAIGSYVFIYSNQREVKVDIIDTLWAQSEDTFNVDVNSTAVICGNLYIENWNYILDGVYTNIITSNQDVYISS